jgi:sugar (pentulose or hexulose) kinase
MSVGDHFLAIDCGSQSLRALVFDPGGRLIAKSTVPFQPWYSPRPGWAEQHPESYWQALQQACAGVMGQTDVQKERLACVAVTSQRGSVVNIDSAGKVLRPAILWMDQRTVREQKPIGGWWGLLFKLAGLSETIRYLQDNAESNWLRIHQPDVWKRTHKYLLLSGYLNYKLTGRYVDSTACQVGYLPFDYKRQNWAPARDWKWDALGIRPEMLPDLRAAGDELGRITRAAAEATGIPEGLPVIAAAADKACEVIGCGGVDPEVGCLSYGTAATFNITTRKYVEAIPFLPPYPAAVRGYYNPEIQIFRGYWMVQWFKNQFAADLAAGAAVRDVEAEQLLEELIRDIPPGSEGLVVQPYWAPGLKLPGPEARGTITGFTDRHTRAHVYRAILEGLAFALREGKERIERRGGFNVAGLRVSGGGSQSDTAMQLTADIFGLPAARPHTFETSGLGTAIIQSVGMGIHPDCKTAVREMSHTERIFEPNDSHHRLYNELYRTVYRPLYARLRPLFRHLRRLFD